MKPAMSLSLKQLPLLPLIAALLAVGGCGGDGKNADDNPSSGLQLLPSGGSGGDTTADSLPEAGAPLALNSDIGGDVDTAKAVVDGSGNVTVVWSQSDGASINLWSSRYTVGGGWSNAQKLEGESLDVKSFRMVVDSVGNVTVVWSQATADSYMTGPIRTDVERTDLWAARYSAVSSGWEAEQRIESANLAALVTENIEDIGEFQLVVDGAGDVAVLWMQHSGSRYDLYASRSVAGVWDVAPTLVDSENLGDVATPQLLVDGSGKLFALWTQFDGNYVNLWGAHYAAAAWSAAAKIDSEDLGDVEAVAPIAVVDNTGAATVVWRQFSSVDNAWNLWRVRYAGGWGAVARVDSAAGDVSAPQLLLYGPTNVMLLWIQSDGAVNNVWSTQYTGGWAANATITDGGGNAGSVVMVKDGAGVVTAVWVQHDAAAFVPQDSLWANRFSGAAWGTPRELETGNGGDVRSPILMADRAGTDRISAIWLQEESGRFDLWSNHYANGSWGSAGLVEGLDEGSAVAPQAVMSSSGNITLVWRHPYDSGNHLVTNNYTAAGAATGWGTVAKVESVVYDDGYDPLVLVAGNGIVTVIWLQPVTETASNRIDLWANRF
jgi:hypothetical protein